MSQQRTSVVMPELGAKSFTCPTCAALAHQSWNSVRVVPYRDDSAPNIVSPDVFDRLDKAEMPSDKKEELTKHFRRLATKEIFIGERADPYSYTLNNIEVSECYSCKALAIWHHASLMYPVGNNQIHIHTDCPVSLRSDIEEARNVLDASPRSAAALLRLGIQKLCIELGLDGKNLNNDIGNLVKNGLDRRIQRALDVVRVVGNNAVHPGQLDLQDDKATASKLFDVINVIIEATITQPKMIDELYENLVPDEAKKAITKRDADKVHH